MGHKVLIKKIIKPESCVFIGGTAFPAGDEVSEMVYIELNDTEWESYKNEKIKEYEKADWKRKYDLRMKYDFLNEIYK
ncbi:MAG: hypothetical protein ACTTJX_04830 [Fusobacterium sp.]|uniref:hypothetical protein n=1 Tax=Fusobacterium sp. TaxID=68766 RepID=UPI003F9F065F